MDFEEDSVLRDYVYWLRGKGYEIGLSGEEQAAGGLTSGEPYILPPENPDPQELRDALQAMNASKLAGDRLKLYLLKERQERN